MENLTSHKLALLVCLCKDLGILGVKEALKRYWLKAKGPGCQPRAEAIADLSDKNSLFKIKSVTLQAYRTKCSP